MKVDNKWNITEITEEDKKFVYSYNNYKNDKVMIKLDTYKDNCNNGKDYIDFKNDTYDDPRKQTTYKYFIQWCETCQKFTTRRGNRVNNDCKKCIGRNMKERGIFNDPNFGLNNPITHQKTIDAQVKNGTGAAGDPKIREKAHKSLIENKPWENDDNWGFKNKETWEKTIKSRNNNSIEAGFKNYNNYQLYIFNIDAIKSGYKNYTDKVEKENINTEMRYNKSIFFNCKNCKKFENCNYKNLNIDDGYTPHSFNDNSEFYCQVENEEKIWSEEYNLYISKQEYDYRNEFNNKIKIANKYGFTKFQVFYFENEIKNLNISFEEFCKNKRKEIDNHEMKINILKKYGFTYHLIRYFDENNISNEEFEKIIKEKRENINKYIKILNSKDQNIRIRTEKINNKFCKNCNKITEHYGNLCTICGKDNYIINYRFVYINGLKCYKRKDGFVEDVETISYNILNNIYDIKDFPEFNIRFGHVCIGSKDIITNEKFIINGNNFRDGKNGKEILNHSTGKYEDSELFYQKFDEKVQDLIFINDEINNLIEEEKFIPEPIIKINNNKWNKEETEHYLKKKNYKYIVYIKLFHGKPWIVGKTGTQLVNKSGIDFNFIIFDPENPDNPNYKGQGRTYAHKYYPDELYSDFDYVLCKNFDSEGDAKEYEQYIARKYNLFQS